MQADSINRNKHHYEPELSNTIIKQHQIMQHLNQFHFMKAIRFRQTSNSLTDIHYEPGQAFSFLNIKQDSLSILGQILNISYLAIFKHILRFSITSQHHNLFNTSFSSHTQALNKRKRFLTAKELVLVP